MKKKAPKKRSKTDITLKVKGTFNDVLLASMGKFKPAKKQK